MGFTSKRGRPSIKASLILIEGSKKEIKPITKKRIKKIANEPIDLCLEKNLITPEEHRAALHFKWLYTIKFGAPIISAIDYDKISARHNRALDQIMQEKHEREYAMAIEKLRKVGALKMVLNFAVFGYYPSFLANYGKKTCTKEKFISYSEITKLREGLDLLVKHWEKPK